MPFESKSPALNVTPLRPVPATPPRRGRPKNLPTPPMPQFEMTAFEQEWYDYFLAAAREEHPDLTKFDNIALMLAAVEFIKYLRLAQREIESGEIMSQTRYHPGTQMKSLLDSLAVTRKARQATKAPATTDHDDEARKFFEGIATR